MPGGRRAAGLLGAGLGGVSDAPADESFRAAPPGTAVGSAASGAPSDGGNIPSISAGRSDNSGNETEADPGGITSRLVGLLASLAGLDSPVPAPAGNSDRGRRAANSGFLTRLTPEPASGGCAAGFSCPLLAGAQSAGFPRSRFGGPFGGGPFGGGPWEPDGLDWFSGELMRHFSAWLWSLRTENCVLQVPPASSSPAASPPLYPLRISKIPTREEALILLNNDSGTQSIDYQYLTSPVPYSMGWEKRL